MRTAPKGNPGPVWYLTTYHNGGTIVRTCTVPAGKALLVYVVGAECSTVEKNGDTFAELRTCTRGGADLVTKADLTVDGTHLNLLTRYRFESPNFTFKYPADFIYGPQPRPGTSKSVGDSFFVLLAPLAAGRHTLELSGQYSPPVRWAGDVTYQLTVRG